MSSRTVRLGFEVGTGAVVDIPVRHIVVCGVTQEAGKTTTLEALITRSGLRALTFVTKRGEGAFAGGRPIAPYFREQADWQFVASILEASRGEKLKIERAWIIRASKGARTLADVQANVKKAMADPRIRNMSADMYLVLDAYLEVVVPQIARTVWAPRLELRAGVNVVDLTGLPFEMQHLVIRSSLDWVLEREESTIVVIPEAWKFVPEGRGTPVKHTALALIRQGAALRNYVWLDSQDIGGVDKAMLRSVPVWILGVQREANEIKRTLANIPATVAKPTATAIALLELGQFYACWGKHAIRTYVQPVWLDDTAAQQVARGVLPVDVLRRTLERPMTSLRAMQTALSGVFGEEGAVTKDEAARLTRENEQLKADNADLRRRLEALEKGRHDAGRTTTPATSEQRPGAGAEHAGVAAAHRTRASRDERASPDGARAAPTGTGRTYTAEDSFDNEALYQAIKARLLEEEPILLKVLTTHPEIVVEVKPRVLTVEGDSMKGRVVRLMARGWVAVIRQEDRVSKPGVERMAIHPGLEARFTEIVATAIAEIRPPGPRPRSRRRPTRHRAEGCRRGRGVIGGTPLSDAARRDCDRIAQSSPGHCLAGDRSRPARVPAQAGVAPPAHSPARGGRG